MANLVKLELSKKQISFQPDQFKDFSRTTSQPEKGDLQVTVVNLSDRFSSFQLELEVGEQKHQGTERWYRVEPDICAKKPPGDRTVFTVTLLRAPVRSYDITIPITVRVLSIEVARLTAEDTLFLKVQRPQKTLHAYLPIEDLTVYPGDRCNIPALLYNLNPTARAVTARLIGIDPNWLPEGNEQVLHLDSGGSGELGFWCAPPPLPTSQHKVYPLLLEVFDEQGNTASARGSLEVLPFGQVTLACAEPRQKVPSSDRRPKESALFDLTLHNQSNLEVSAQLESESLVAGRSHQIEMPAAINIASDNTETLPVQVRAVRPWLGARRMDAIDIVPRLTMPGSGDGIPKIPVHPYSQRLELELLPRIPLWLQILGALLALGLLGLGAWLLPRRHHGAPVTALTLMSNGDTVISGSSDQTLRRWQVNPESWLPDIRRIKPAGVLTNDGLGKSVRTLRHLPEEVSQIAVGLENGEIQIWDIAARSQLRRFHEGDRPDRVFALDFTEDSRYLFSGHGSGQVRVWNPATDSDEPLRRLYPPNGAFAVSALTSMEVESQPPIVAIGGQYNRLMLWRWDDDQAFNILYSTELKVPSTTAFEPVISRQSFLTSLTGADDATVMASADSHGYITLWNMTALDECMERQANTYRTFGITQQPMDSGGTVYGDIDIDQDCSSAVLDQWSATANGQAVRAVALTANGCFLSSVGDDGRVILWPLTQTYERSPQHIAGLELKRYPRAKLNTVDIHRDTAANQEDVILVAHDIPGNRVQIHRRQVKRNGCQ